MHCPCRRLLFQVRLNKPYQRFVWQSSARRFYDYFINFRIQFFSSLFSRLLLYKLNSFLVVMALLLNHDGFGRNWIYCASRFHKIAAGIKKYFLPKKRFHASFSSQLSLLSRFLKVLKNRIRQYFITYNLKTRFLTRSKQNWPLKWKKKSLLFLPASACRRDRVCFAFIWWHFPDRRVSGKTPRADHTWQNPPRLSY